MDSGVVLAVVLTVTASQPKKTAMQWWTTRSGVSGANDWWNVLGECAEEAWSSIIVVEVESMSAARRLW